MEGSEWSVCGSLKVKVKANHLCGEGTPKYEVSLKPGDLSVCMFMHKTAGLEAINMSRWVEKWELIVKEGRKRDPMGVKEIKNVEGLGTKGM